ncbi:MAG: hypothetical protein OXP71_05770 [Candidatus Poribacteria bacterium]|nr:hypothetical protein [Candidatus Poribacteria bacterium]
MVNHRAKPYFIAGSILAVLSLSYIGIRAYKGHVELNQVLSDARLVNRSVGARHSHSSDNHAHVREGTPLTTAPQHDHNHFVGHEGYKSYEIDGINIHVKEALSSRPMSKENLEINEWIVYGKLTPYLEKRLKKAELKRQQNAGRVLQQVITPDGKLGMVAVDKDDQYKDGDAILRSDLITRSHPWGFSEDQVNEKRSEEFKLIEDGVEYPMPEEYYALDVYKRKEYVKKFRLTLDLDISMDDVEAKIAAGELDASLTDAEKKQIDAISAIDAAILEEQKHRLGLLVDTMTPKPTPSDLPPVNVTFKPDAKYGHAPPEGRPHIDDDGFWESVLADVETASDETIVEPLPTLNAAPELPISTPRVNRDPDDAHRVPMEEVTPIPDNLTPASVKAQLKERFTPEQFSKAQQLLDEYGAEEGLRRFREMPPDHNGAQRHSHDNLGNSIR